MCMLLTLYGQLRQLDMLVDRLFNFMNRPEIVIAKHSVLMNKCVLNRFADIARYAPSQQYDLMYSRLISTMHFLDTNFLKQNSKVTKSITSAKRRKLTYDNMNDLSLVVSIEKSMMSVQHAAQMLCVLLSVMELDPEDVPLWEEKLTLSWIDWLKPLLKELRKMKEDLPAMSQPQLLLPIYQLVYAYGERFPAFTRKHLSFKWCRKQSRMATTSLTLWMEQSPDTYFTFIDLLFTCVQDNGNPKDKIVPSSSICKCLFAPIEGIDFIDDSLMSKSRMDFEQAYWKRLLKHLNLLAYLMDGIYQKKVMKALIALYLRECQLTNNNNNNNNSSKMVLVSLTSETFHELWPLHGNFTPEKMSFWFHYILIDAISSLGYSKDGYV